MKVTTSTIATTSFGKLRGYTLEVLNLLEKESLTSRNISERTLKTNPYVQTYLCRLRNYGLAENNEHFWFLTDKGVKIWNFLKKNYYFHLTNNRTTTQQQQNNNTYFYKKPLQVSISSWSGKNNLSDCEKEVVELLIKHFNDTSSKYIFFQDPYTLSEKTGFNVETLRVALQNLRQDNIIYLIRDRTQNCWKLGLKKAFIELLEGGE